MLMLACLTLSARGGVIRDDRADEDYRALGNLPQYQAVGQVRTVVSGGNRLCSGTLIAPDWVLTAAHCLVDTAPGSVQYRNLGQSLAASQVIVHPQFTGVASNGNDVGLFQLQSPSSLFKPATRMRDSIPLGATATIVGFGLTGNGLTGSQTGTQGTKRAGQNVVDVNGLRVLGGDERPYPEYLLFTDFDNPHSSADSVWGSSTPLELEYQTAPGDSGGGWFVNHDGIDQLYAVHSIGLSFDEESDNDYGDAAGATRVTRFNSWIDEQLGAVYWMNPAGGEFAAPENWSSSTAPPTDQPLRFAFPQSMAVQVSGPQAVAELQIDRGNVSFNLADSALQLNAVRMAPDAATSFQVPAESEVVIAGAVSGGGNITKTGAGSLRYSTSQPFTSKLTLSAGKLAISAGDALELSEFQLGDAEPLEIEIESAATFRTSQALPLGVNGRVEIASGGGLSAASLQQSGEVQLAGGTLQIDGDWTQSPSASTFIDLESLFLNAAETPITIGAATTLGGELQLLLPDEFQIDPNLAFGSRSTWTLLTSGGDVSGAFAQVEWLNLPEGMEFTLEYESHTVLVVLDRLPHAMLRQPGDTNGDDVVDLADLNNVRSNFGALRGLGDTDGNGTIDLADLNAVRNHFGEGLALRSTTVPEPAALLLAALGLAALAGMGLRHARAS